ncbi:TPA: hypothetical protein DEP30_02275 [Candidatus Nomurabacteria bacterium]|nr:MAG: hypothetical protein UR97_C0003G0037 [Candidatus Nomurabacteria bacterium GW2011_GWE2_36_115]KKP94095.1 MAG: hypothetical protein US00_C0003G0019 [Candidatus Nomurabacteria bacterium GW2011_GWF2_36_126]KKP96777.1 MAG: hypothetical protein US04_C0001G0279 [Candidatus Nomurabacteria bacterium GW2011_GWD2_36_14]KKP99619.1 MAG: hypothetical protein US08_C0001G0302 [Candidatus Nomurabacteria bacterium GW2011_GWF2_36_19]KKQ05465.1 MAG: hypothetical protein US17_C0004G0037 [Candidatus Nomuraba
MNIAILTKFNMDEKDTLPLDSGNNDEFPMSVSEKLVRNEVRKLTENSKEIKKLKEQIEKKNNKNKSDL